MPFIVTAKQKGDRWVVDPCPSCGRKHRHAETGTQKATCGMTYVIVEPPAVPASPPFGTWS